MNQKKGKGTLAFSFVEVLVATALCGIAFTGLMAGISYAFAVTQVTRENLRATQIMVEKLETLRLYSWTQINSNGFIPTRFTNYYAEGSTAGTNNGVAYTGTFTFSSAPIIASYSNNLKQVTVSISWASGKSTRTRSMSTMVARDGLQNYVY